MKNLEWVVGCSMQRHQRRAARLGTLRDTFPSWRVTTEFFYRNATYLLGYRLAGYLKLSCIYTILMRSEIKEKSKLSCVYWRMEVMVDIWKISPLIFENTPVIFYISYYDLFQKQICHTNCSFIETTETTTNLIYNIYLFWWNMIEKTTLHRKV